MRLDIRLPLGLLFLIFGLLLLAFGILSNKALYTRSLGINVNLWWGAVMLLFGGTLLLLGRRSHRRMANHSSSSQPDSLGKSASESE